MNLETGLAVFGALATATNLLNAYMSNKVRAEITALKLEVADQRSKDREWLESRFVPRTEFEVRLRPFETRIGI